MNDNMMYQVSTLQALALGYTRPVVTVEELLRHGTTGLGTFESVDGEMIVCDQLRWARKREKFAALAPLREIDARSARSIFPEDAVSGKND